METPDSGKCRRRRSSHRGETKPKATPNEPWEAEAEEEGAFWAPPALLPLLPLLFDGTKRLSREVAREEILVDVDTGVSVSA